MPSNKEYKEQAEELAAKLEIPVTTDGLKNEELAELVSDLKAKVRDAELATQADGLVGSDGFEDAYDIGGKSVPLVNIVSGAFESSELTVEQWNDLPEEERAAKMGVELARLRDEAEAEARRKAEQEAAEAEKAKQEKAKKPPFSVGERKAITTKRGIIGAGDEIKATDLAGGQSALDAFIKSGHVVKN